jgi:two-component system, sensor histidine kinase and response regulator
MPGVDGFTLAEQIKADPAFPRNVVLMPTSPDQQASIRRIRPVAATACLHKPIHPFELMNAILAALGQKPRADQPPSPSEALAPRPLRILMAEDNPFNQRVAALMLAKYGHLVTIVANGREAIAALGRLSFDLVLMDLQMPVMDGFQATAAIRSAEAGTARHVPIIALTAHAMKEDRDRCLEAGMDDYVSKPIQQDKLVKAIEDCVCLIRATVEAEPPAGASGSPMDVAAALARVNGDRGFLGEMAVIFLEESPRLLAQIRDAIAADDPAGLVTPAHSLKNWAGNFVAQAAFEAMMDLEALGRAGALANAGTVLATLEREIERLRSAVAEFDREPAHLDGDGNLSVLATDSGSLPCTL